MATGQYLRTNTDYKSPMMFSTHLNNGCQQRIQPYQRKMRSLYWVGRMLNADVAMLDAVLEARSKPRSVLYHLHTWFYQLMG